jgi:hypothetical protein
VGEGAVASDLKSTSECEEQDASKKGDREGVQIERIGEVAAESGTGGACATAEEARETGEGFETARQCRERWI